MFNMLNMRDEEGKELADGVQIPLPIVLAAAQSFAGAAEAFASA